MWQIIFGGLLILWGLSAISDASRELSSSENNSGDNDTSIQKQIEDECKALENEIRNEVEENVS